MFEEVELFVDLDEFEGGSGAPVLFFGETVVGVALVFGGFAHFECDWRFLEIGIVEFEVVELVVEGWNFGGDYVMSWRRGIFALVQLKYRTIKCFSSSSGM